MADEKKTISKESSFPEVEKELYPDESLNLIAFNMLNNFYRLDENKHVLELIRLYNISHISVRMVSNPDFVNRAGSKNLALIYQESMELYEYLNNNIREDLKEKIYKNLERVTLSHTKPGSKYVRSGSVPKYESSPNLEDTKLAHEAAKDIDNFKIGLGEVL